MSRVPSWIPLPVVPWSQRIYGDILEAAEETRFARRAGVVAFEERKRAELAAARREAIARAAVDDQKAAELARGWREELRQKRIAEIRRKLDEEEGKDGAD